MKEWIDFIKSIPGLAKSVAELLGGVTQAGLAGLRIAEAKAKQISTAIEDETEMKSAVSKALTDAGVKYVQKNAEALGQRALSHAASKIIQQQINREAVVVNALEDLRNDPPKKSPSETPSDDWLNLFGSYAERASSEKLRQHWGRILSGEIRKPGSFSMATLQLASILDQKLAKTIERVIPWIADEEFIPIIGPLTVGKLYSDLVTLDGIGFLRLGAGSKIYQFPAPGNFGYSISLKGGFLRLNGKSGSRTDLRAAFLTLGGQELLSILTREESPELRPLLMQELQKRGTTAEWNGPS